MTEHGRHGDFLDVAVPGQTVGQKKMKKLEKDGA